MNCTEISKADTKVDVPQNVTFFCECNSVRIGQNIQNDVRWKDLSLLTLLLTDLLT